MNRKIPGDALRDKLLARLKDSRVQEPTEEARIKALSSSGNRELLEIVATRKPQSIGELATLAGRLQPNVSRSLSVLMQAGLLAVVPDGRKSVPTLTSHGQRKAEELEIVSREESGSGFAEPASREAFPFSAEIADREDSRVDSDEVRANITVRFPSIADRMAVAHAEVDLNEVCANLLANWWCVLYRRGNTWKLFALKKMEEGYGSDGMLLIEATGRIELSARLQDSESKAPRILLGTGEFTEIALDILVRPLVEHLRARKRFDRPVESLLGRTEEVLSNKADLAFWKCAGALGLTYRNVDDAGADEVASLIAAISDEDARLDFASAVAPGQLGQSLKWASGEVTRKAKMNCLPRLVELGRIARIGSPAIEPWRIGAAGARRVRNEIGMAPNQSVGGLAGLARLFGNSSTLVESDAGEELIRGYVGRGDDIPVVIVKDEGPKTRRFWRAVRSAISWCTAVARRRSRISIQIGRLLAELSRPSSLLRDRQWSTWSIGNICRWIE